MQRLLYITTNLDNSGGVARILSVKLNYLVETYGYHVSVINTNTITDIFFYHFSSKIKFYSIETKNLFKYRNELREVVDRINPNIIINCDNGLKGALLPFLINYKRALLYERHCGSSVLTDGLLERLKFKVSNAVLKLRIKKYRAFVVLNTEEEQDWKSNNVLVISNPMWFKSDSTIALLKNKTTIAVGRFSYQKGYDVLLNIWKIVVDNYPEWKLNIYGEGDKDNFIELALELDVLDSVQFLNPVEDIKSVYLNASMLLNTSRYEPFGLSVIEAMACGLPVITFDNALGPKNYIISGENGFLIEKDNLEIYAQKIMFLMENEDERLRISSNAKNVVKDYNLDAIMKQWHELFQSIQ